MRTPARASGTRPRSAAKRRFPTGDTRPDSTERKRAEESAQRSESLLRAVLDNSPAATFVKDLQGRFVLVNKRFAELAGRPGDDLIGQPGYPLLHGAEEAMMLEADQAVMTGAVPIEREEVFGSSEGQRTFLTVRFPLFGPNGALTGICGIFTDVTDRTVLTVGSPGSDPSASGAKCLQIAVSARGTAARAGNNRRAQRLFPARGGDTLWRMCRYGLTTYKPHYACFACRKAFRRRLRSDQPHLGSRPDRPARCPQCGLLMASMGLDFKPPRQTDEKAWELLGKLWEVGVTFHSCGCGGPGYRPREPRAYQEFLRSTLEEYRQQLKRWKEGTPTTPRALDEQREAVQSWQARIDRVLAALSG